MFSFERGGDHERDLPSSFIFREEVVKDPVQFFLVLDLQQRHEVDDDEHEDRHRVSDFDIAFCLEPFLDLDFLTDIKGSGNDQLAVDLHAFTDIRILLCDHIAADLAPVPDPCVAACPDILADLRGFADVDVCSPQPVIDLAELPDHDIPVGLDAVLLQFCAIRKQAVLMPVFYGSLFHRSPEVLIRPRICVTC